MFADVPVRQLEGSIRTEPFVTLPEVPLEELILTARSEEVQDRRLEELILMERCAEVPVETSSRFELQFNDGLLSASVNGQRSHERAKAPPKVTYSPQEFLVGLGAFSDSNETALRYRRVQLRLVAPANSPARN